MVRSTWPGMDIERPERTDQKTATLLHMFCPEDRYPREIYWAGFGFQVWCQMLTFLLQARGASLFVIDEPDIYLHSDLQRQLVDLFGAIGCPVILATHSTEIISEVEPDCVLNVNKRNRSARRVSNSKELQDIFSTLGSNLNPTLTQIAKSRRVLFVEGKDFQILSKFARKLKLTSVANRSGFAVVSVEGFNPARVRDFAQGMESTLDAKLLKGVVFDRDFRSTEEVKAISEDLTRFCSFATIHGCKEIENFVLVPSAIRRAVTRQAEKRKIADPLTDDLLLRILCEIAAGMKNRVQAHYVKFYCDFKRKRTPGIDLATLSETAMNDFDKMWSTLESRLAIVPGKETISSLNTRLQSDFGINVSATQIVDCLTESEVPQEMKDLLSQLEVFGKSVPPTDPEV